MGKIETLQYGFNDIIQEDNLTAEVYIDNHNKRIKLLDYQGEIGKLPGYLIQICKKHGFGKIICTVKEEDCRSFIDTGFVVEGSIAGFFKGVTGYCISYFTDEKRIISDSIDEEDEIVRRAQELKNRFVPGSNSFTIRTASENDIESIARLFDAVFKTYPTPMNSPQYIRKVINTRVMFKVAFADENLVSAASADMDAKLLNAEITDCATLHDYRGKGILSELVHSLEQELIQRGFITLYSLSRALSSGINIVLSKHGYDYTGRLINNCNIMGRFEDMNIWVKKLQRA